MVDEEFFEPEDIHTIIAAARSIPRRVVVVSESEDPTEEYPWDLRTGVGVAGPSEQIRERLLARPLDDDERRAVAVLLRGASHLADEIERLRELAGDM